MRSCWRYSYCLLAYSRGRLSQAVLQQFRGASEKIKQDLPLVLPYFRIFSIQHFLVDRSRLLVRVRACFEVRNNGNGLFYCSHGSYIVHMVVEWP